MRNLADRLDLFAEPWMPGLGEKLIGEVVELDERENEYGSYPVVTVLTDEGEERSFHAFRTVAKNELAKQRPQVGDRIGIVYLGKPEGKDYELYRIKVERGEQSNSIDWDKHASEPSEPSETPPADDGIPF